MNATTYTIALDAHATSLQHVYWGRRIPTKSAIEMAQPITYFAPFESSIGVSREEYGPWGEMRFGEPSLKVEYADGTRAIEWRYETHGIEQTADSHTLWLQFRDQFYPLEVTLYYKIYDEQDIVERWTQLANVGGGGPISVEQAFSADWRLPLHENYRLTYLQGRWGKEFQVTETNVVPGKFVIESRRGATSHQFNPWLAFDQDATATENSGEVWSVALGWSGSWKVVTEMTPQGQVHCTGGINDFDFRYVLQEHARLDLPIFVGTFSSEGFGGVSRQWHNYEREHVLPTFSTTIRPVLYNSWEATAFAVTEQNQVALAEKAATLGVELFVMDDGWFGERHLDTAGLGDWVVNSEKFPHGLHPLIKRVNELGMQFGIWVEPEMINADSNLYREHPEWVYHFNNRTRTESRNQLVLNLARTDVRDWMLKTMDELLTENNIEFVKWDLNRSFSEPGWPDAPGDNPQRVWTDHVRNLYWVFDELRHRHPNVAFESCSGGGGRVDLGILSRVEQVWTSDNTDALDRLRIQEGYSYAYVPRTMMCWVTDCPNYLTRRTVPLSFRFHVAMAGSLGVGGDLKHWTEQEMAEAKAHIAAYKRVRHVIQNGSLYRLNSPRTGEVTASQYVSRDKNEVVVLAWGHSQQFGEHDIVLQLLGLDAEASYYDAENKTTCSGAYLMQKGIHVPLIGDYDSRLLHFVRVE